MPIEITIRCTWCKQMQAASEFPTIPIRTGADKRRRHVRGQYCRTCRLKNPNLLQQIQALDAEEPDR